MLPVITSRDVVATSTERKRYRSLNMTNNYFVINYNYSFAQLSEEYFVVESKTCYKLTRYTLMKLKITLSAKLANG